VADATAAPPPFLGQILAGITVSLAMVPESLAFTFVAGVSPICGLHAAALMGLTTAALGAQPGVISGAAGATAVVFAPLVASHGPEYLFAAVLMAGVIQLACGAARLGKLIRLVPNTCMIGFVNGLAIVIGAAQLASFRNLTGAALYTQVALTAITAALIKGLGSKRAAFWPRQIPAPLAAIVLVTLLANVVAPDAFAAAKTVGDVAAVSGALPVFHLPNVPFDLHTLTVIAPFAASVAAVGLIETLLTQQLVDETTLTRTSTHKEVVAQGVGNVVCGVFASMGGCAMIGQSVINVQAGGTDARRRDHVRPRHPRLRHLRRVGHREDPNRRARRHDALPGRRHLRVVLLLARVQDSENGRRRHRAGDLRDGGHQPGGRGLRGGRGVRARLRLEERQARRRRAARRT
jgi:MFS superfamily sulfate permease-like transporter